MALKLGKLDAICARLKKTSAVDVKATTQNGVHAAEVTAGAEGHAKDDAKNATTNNNEETVTDLNETPSTEATTSAVANTSQEAEDDEASLLHETLSIPVSTPALTSTPTQQTGGSSGRRKRRKAAKPRIVSQIQEPFDSDFYEGERGEGEGENSVEGIYGFGGAGLEGVDKTLAQRHFENLASLKAVPVDASPKLVARPLERIASKLLNGGQAVHKDVATSANNLSLEGKKSAEIDRSM
nr:hypothetical protein BaRGS_017734 [Batillaria attramentaria]